MSIKHQLGLIGYPLTHSFSKKYFSQKFIEENINGFHYELFPIASITDLKELVNSQPNLLGLNITIPYKQEVLPFLDDISEEAEKVGAVNTLKFKNGKVKGYNSDVYGFEISLKKLLQPCTTPFNELNALILGTGGAAKAVMYVLDKLDINYQLVSRKAASGRITYKMVDKKCLEKHQLIINTTPLGMSPKLDTAPDLPYKYLNDQHFLYDLVYNPEISKFLNMGIMNNSHIMNGIDMLYLQAEKSWSIWLDANE